MQFLFLNIQQAAVGDYIFLILVLVATLIQAFSQNKKKAMMKQQEENEKSSPHPFDEEEEEYFPPQRPKSESPFGPIFDQLDQILGEEGVPSVVVEKPKPKIVVRREDTPAETMAAEYLARRNAEMETRIKEGQRTIEMARPVAETAPTAVSKSPRKINMRQAVIYSEILNRKYS